MKTDIYIYGTLDFIGKSAAAKRMMYYAKALADDKKNVYLAGCSDSKITIENFIEIEPGIFVLENKSPTKSIFGSLSFLRKLHFFSKANKNPAAFILYPQSFFYLELWSVIYMIFIKKNQVYYELNEVKKYYLFLYKSISSSKTKAFLTIIIRKIHFSIMDYLMQFHAGLICISTNIETYGKNYNRNTIRIPILTNPRLQINKTDKLYADSNCFNIGFSGSIVPEKENLLEFIVVINKALDNGFHIKFNLCGTITKKNFNIILDACNSKESITYHGNLDQNELSNFLTQQDLLVIPRGNTLQNKYGFSTKLSDYLNHQKIILITDISDNSLYIKDEVNGFIVDPNNSKMMYDKLIYIIKNFAELETEIIENAFKTSKESFDYKLYKSELQLFLKPKSS
jgi:glycosyltransferase involved in cell wall biosynthesis